MNSKEFRRWLTQQGATFEPAKGSHVKVYLNGKQSVLPMHNADLKKGTLEGIKKQLGLSPRDTVPATHGKDISARDTVPAIHGKDIK